MDAEDPELVPALGVPHILWKEHGKITRRVRMFRQRPGEEARSGRIEHLVLGAKDARYALHHGLHPRRSFLRPDAVLDHRGKVGMARSGPESIVANLPIHLVSLAEKPAQRQLLEGKNASVIEQGLEALRKKNVEVEIETAETKHGKVAEEIDLLDHLGKAVEDRLILWKFCGDEATNLIVVEKKIFPIRME